MEVEWESVRRTNFLFLGFFVAPEDPFSTILQLASPTKLKGSQHNNRDVNISYATTRSNMTSGKRVLDLLYKQAFLSILLAQTLLLVNLSKMYTKLINTSSFQPKPT
jgi:hypothetical protein